MLTCKEFLHELADYPNIMADEASRRELEAHIRECSKCHLTLNAIREIIKVYKGMRPREIPEVVHVRLMMAVERKMALKKPAAGA